MVDLDILKERGGTPERLREFFEAKLPKSQRALNKLTPQQRKAIERDMDKRKEFETWIGSVLQEHVPFIVHNSSLYGAVDLAWDSVALNKRTIPLMLYAQGRVDVQSAATELAKVPDGDKFIRRNDKGNVIGIDLPKFCEVNINLIRSVITRRVAAQSNKYSNLWPFFKYEPRSATSQVGRLRAELVSQRMDIMADQYDYRHFQTQVCRDMFLYGHSVAFPACAWDREIQWERVPVADEFSTDGPTQRRAKIVKEGVPWVNSHPLRVFHDKAGGPLASLNSDTGCEYVGFFDVAKWGSVERNAAYYNRDEVHFTSSLGWLTAFPDYFLQYFGQTTAPVIKASGVPAELSKANDLKSNIGIYSPDQLDAAVFVTNLYRKIIPQDYGLADYPYPVWLRLVVAGDDTVMFAEWLPSSPAAVFSLNEHDGRLVNISQAHELMGFQDQLTNLFSQFIETAQADLFSVAVLNTDIFPDTDDGRRVRDAFKTALQGKDFYAGMQILETSFAKLKEMEISVSADNIFKVVRSAPNTALTAILQGIAQVIQMAERLMVMSPQEQGQPAPREISATEVNLIAGTTESVYSFISDAIDEGRAAMTRICYESFVACGTDEVYLPVVETYPDAVIQAAGLTVAAPEPGEDGGPPSQYKAVTGSKRKLVHDYTFTSRDGGERASNSAAASTLVNLLGNIGSLTEPAQIAILQAMGKQKLFDHVNEIYRLVGASVGMNLQLKPGESDDLLPEAGQQVVSAVDQLAKQTAHNTEMIQLIAQKLGGGAPTPQAQAPTL